MDAKDLSEKKNIALQNNTIVSLDFLINET